MAPWCCRAAIQWTARWSCARARIVAAGAVDGEWEAARQIDASGSLVLPGAVDAHVHCLSDPTEGITAATTAAAAGGVTTIIEMPFDAGAPINNAERFEAKRERVAAEAVVDVALLATLAKRGGLDQVGPLARAGACGFKLSLFETDVNRFPQIPDDELLQAFRLIGEVDLPVGVHAENTDIIRTLVATLREAGRTDPRAHCESRPPVSETEAILRALEFARASGARLHIYHVSLPRGVELANLYSRWGAAATTETCPHYLLLNEDDMPWLGARGKINPPLRTAADSAGLWEALADGSINIATSDHAPWKPDKKDKADIFDNASGTPWRGDAVAPAVQRGGGAGTPHSPATRRRALRRAGAVVRPGPPQGTAWRRGTTPTSWCSTPTLAGPSTARRSTRPRAGVPTMAGRFEGRVTHTLVRGRVAFEDGKVVGSAGLGEFIPYPLANADCRILERAGTP